MYERNASRRLAAEQDRCSSVRVEASTRRSRSCVDDMPSSIALAQRIILASSEAEAIDPRSCSMRSQSDFGQRVEIAFVGTTRSGQSAQMSFDSFELPLPPLPVQRRIAGILSAYDELIENSQRRIQILEAMARALYREWFVHSGSPATRSIPRVASPLGDIPKGGR